MGSEQSRGKPAAALAEAQSAIKDARRRIAMEDRGKKMRGPNRSDRAHYRFFAF
jgi:hypothetical protein